MKQARTLTDAEFRRLMAVTVTGRHSARNRCAIALSYFGGMRVGEIAKLLIGDVYETDGSVRDQIVLPAAYTKTNERRSVFVGTKLARELQRYAQNGLGGVGPNDPLLTSQKGGRFSANSLCQLFGRLYLEAGLSGASSHSGRRTFITKLAGAGVSAKAIMTLAGHRNLATTQRYIDVTDEMLKAAVEHA